MGSVSGLVFQDKAAKNDAKGTRKHRHDQRDGPEYGGTQSPAGPWLATSLSASLARGEELFVPFRRFDGLITNDKFCLVRRLDVAVPGQWRMRAHS